MKRLSYLNNKMFTERYKEVYKILFTADLDRIADHSNWFKEGPGYVKSHTPLWIIAESKIINKRIWIVESFGDLEITTAQLDLNVKTTEYSDSYKTFKFKTQKQMTDYLEKLLSPCL